MTLALGDLDVDATGQQSWREHFCDHHYRFWHDADIDDLIQQQYPTYWPMYRDFPLTIMRIDFARFCILHHCGGIYADMDVFCYREFCADIVAPIMIMEAPWGDVFLENALMSAVPGHDFFRSCMELSCQRWHQRVRKHFRGGSTAIKDQKIITAAAGPHCVAAVFRKYGQDQVRLFPGQWFNNHGLSWDPEFRTKHVLTGMWGKETLDNCQQHWHHEESGVGYQEWLGQRWLQDANRYAKLDVPSIYQFDFYHDYTQGGYIKTHCETDTAREDIEPDSGLADQDSYG